MLKKNSRCKKFVLKLSSEIYNLLQDKNVIYRLKNGISIKNSPLPTPVSPIFVKRSILNVRQNHRAARQRGKSTTLTYLYGETSSLRNMFRLVVIVVFKNQKLLNGSTFITVVLIVIDIIAVVTAVITVIITIIVIVIVIVIEVDVSCLGRLRHQSRTCARKVKNSISICYIRHIRHILNIIYSNLVLFLNRLIHNNSAAFFTELTVQIVWIALTLLSTFTIDLILQIPTNSKLCSIRCLSGLSGPSIKNSAYPKCEPHTHPFLRCSKTSILSQKRIAEAPCEPKQKCKSRKGKIDLSKKTQKSKFICRLSTKQRNRKHCKHCHINYEKYGKKWFIKIYKKLSSLLLICCGDIEVNPGPEKMTIITQNCRGLKKESKIKQLINRIYKSHSNSTFLIVALQETHLDNSNVKYQWKGQHIITDGTGNQGGCITLLSENIKIIKQIDISTEAHVALVELIGGNYSKEMIIVNLHAPCAHNKAKIEFFTSIKNKIEDMQSGNDTELIILGDFNTVMSKSERINTHFSRAEKMISRLITNMCDDLNLRDCWSKGNNAMTWRHGEKMSKIDRILFSCSLTYSKVETKTDWTYTESDHAAVIVELTKQHVFTTERVTRIDTSFMSNVILKHKFLCELKIKLEQMTETNMNPHQKLEYLKVMIRSIALEIAAEEKKKSEAEHKNLKEEINFWQSAFENSQSELYRQLSVSNLNELTAKRDEYLNKRGEFLSNRNKSKWYQEGERSTKYFLNLQKSKGRKTEMSELIIDGMDINDREEINKYVESFYKTLYEKGDKNEINRDELDAFVDIEPLSQEKINKMEIDITKDDLLKTLKSCSDSSPGPDGIPYSIIKTTWNYYGDILLDCWRFSQLTNELTHSHRSSYLRLIPKDGKDPKILKNWRPITLSNCDIKLITKTLSRKLTSALEDTISVSQTAYIPGRQITDNLHQMLHMIEESNKTKTDSMLISLDAEKAFDSVEHWYIKAILLKLGLKEFTKTFELLYKNQMVNILLNGSKAGSYTIKNGVKQGDALSCILFILSIEPLIRNIQKDESIKKVNTSTGCSKIVAYADDISCMIKPDPDSIQKIFSHYEKLTKLSGLKLNADKTELISNGHSTNYNITYLNQSHSIDISDSIKVNGLVLSYDNETMHNLNFGKLYNSMDNQLRAWSNRGLSLLGKILIYKTFGLSQILFIGSVVQLTKKEEAKITELIFKFIWNRDMDKRKAPDRIKRQTIYKPISKLGFGMIDFRDVLKSIKIKTVLRILNYRDHPLKDIIVSNINGSWINIKPINDFRPPISYAITEICALWKAYLLNTTDHNLQLLEIISKEYIGNLTEFKYRNKRISINHRNDTVKEILTDSWHHAVRLKLTKEVKRLLDTWTGSRNLEEVVPANIKKLPIGMKLISTSIITSKMLRHSLNLINPNNEFKTVGKLTDEQVSNLGRQIKRLTNVKLKSVTLRLIHGDIYCATRMKKFGMVDSDSCERCGKEETIEHLILKCDYTKKIWDIISALTNIQHDTIKTIVGIDPFHDKTTLTINSEIVRQLLAITRPTIEPQIFVENTIKRLSIIEKGITKYQTLKLLDRLKELLPVTQ